MENYQFTFITEQDYNRAKSSGHISSYNIVRVKCYNKSGGSYDFPVHSKEEFTKITQELKDSGKEYDVYPSKHYYDIQEYD